MKRGANVKLQTMITTVLCVVTLCACGPSREWQDFSHPHKLHRLSTDQGMSGSFFMFSGGITGELHVYMSFLYRGKYVICHLPITECRIELNPTIDIPTVQFSCRDYGDFYPDDIQKCLRNGCRGAVITCKPEDWAPNITMPLSSRK
jgi:hypothetical protein